jgi:glycosyltransferase 2 family protein
MQRATSKNREERRAGRKGGKRRLWMALLAVAAVSLAAFLLYRTLSRYSFDEIVASVLAVPAARLAGAAGFAAASYICLTGFDWLAVRYAGEPLPYRKTALASFCSLSLGHNIGLAFLSSGAIRYRFYARWGLSAGDVAKVILFCGSTVALGLAILGGIALLLRADLAEDITGLNRMVVVGLGLACLACAAIYLLLAAFVRGALKVRKWRLEMPPFRLALGQAVVGPLNFACVAACLHQALASAADLPYLAVAPVYVIANVTSLISHVPGGLGVIESVVMFLLPGANLIGALLVFRFVYFLVPLALGGTVLGITEVVFRRRDAGKRSGALRPAST